jgi:probable DNA repair protein
MTDNLLAAAEEGVSIVTASRRLARSLLQEFARSMHSRGITAWRTPVIKPYSRWLKDSLEELSDGRNAYCASTAQSRVLWEECIREVLPEAAPQLGPVVRSAMEAWMLVHSFEVPVDEIQQEIDSRDQRVFALAAARYRERLRSLGWLDDALLPGALIASLGEAAQPAGREVMFAGFDRVTPVQRTLSERLAESGVAAAFEGHGPSRKLSIAAYDTCEAELRSAGRWARDRLLADPNERLAIIVSGLERDPDGIGRLIREGFVPGWQTGSAAAGHSVNVSLGRQLDDYPLIAIALLAVRWLHAPLTSRELGVLLRCSFIGVETSGARARLESELRKVAARDWTPARAERVLGRREPEADVADFLQRVAAIEALLKDRPASRSPRYWARYFDEALRILGWPGSSQLDSLEHQLLNRWRELLGEFAALESVTGGLTIARAAERLRQLARESVFQPEATGATLDVLGPLEAAGLRFDAVWVVGLTAEAWPGRGGATPLVSRGVQRRYGMPDATPEDTREFAATVLKRIGASANTVTGSFARLDGDSEQGPSLLDEVATTATPSADPGWHAEQFRGERQIVLISPETVPAVEPEEKIRGGASTINLQISEPFAAFARGRLGITTLDPFAEGLTPVLRGNLLHDALQQLYRGLPSQVQIQAWSDAELDERAAIAAERAVRGHRFAAGVTLERLLDFEEQRIVELLKEVVALDCNRPPFRIASVEGKSSGVVGGIELELRHDRIDEADDDSIIILDYKTGMARPFLVKGEPRDYQLVVYAATASVPVSDIGLYNVDRRAVKISGVGETLSGDADFADSLSAWMHVVDAAAGLFRSGDTRVNCAQPAVDARGHALVSRFQELTRNA